MPRKSKLNLPAIHKSGETTGQRILQLRKERALSQKEVAEAIGITQGMVSQYENDTLRLTDDMICRFAIVLNVSADIILGLPFKHQRFQPVIKRKYIYRIRYIEKLSQSEQKHILSMIDLFLGIKWNKRKKEKFEEVKKEKTIQPKKAEINEEIKPIADKKIVVDRKKTWTDEEIEILEIFYPRSSEKVILEMLPKKGWFQCVGKAEELGIVRMVKEKPERGFKKKPLKNTVKKAELEKLLRNPSYTIYDIAKKLRTSPDVIRRYLFKKDKEKLE